MSAAPPEMSVVVVNWNGVDHLTACLDSLERQSRVPAEIVVVDHGSNDGSADLVRRRFPRCVLVETGGNLGFAEGFNRGVERCTRPWVATLNNDAEAEPTWIEALSAAVARLPPTTGMLQSRIVFADEPDRTNSTGVLFRRDATFVDRDFRTAVREHDTEGEIFCPSAGAAAYRRSMLDAVRLPSGIFDRSFFMYFEDVDFGWRARLAGWSAVYVPGAVARHVFHGSTSMQPGPFVLLHCRRNRLRTLLKNGSAGLALRTLPRSLVDLAGSAKRVGPAVLPGFAQALRDGWAQRAAVGRLSTLGRREVERRWVGVRQ